MADRPDTHESERTRREQLRLAGMGALVALGVVFALVNLDEVKVDYIFGTAHIPLFFVIVACGVLGVVFDRLYSRWQARRRTG